MNRPRQPGVDDASPSGTGSPAGALRVFFGYVPGERLTGAMVRAAEARREAGADVAFVGLETPGLCEYGAQRDRAAHQAGNRLFEAFDLDAVLARRPELVALEDLARANPPAGRHAKRWQDIEELLAAGIDVYTTACVQQIESLGSIVERICQAAPRDTFPDHVLDRAAEITIIDCPPDELLAELESGIADVRAAPPATPLGRESLVALRELALRQAADHVDKQVQSARKATASPHTWPTQERILVCVGPSPTSAKVIRAARRLAGRLQAQWLAVYVETRHDASALPAARRRVLEHLRLAEALGAEVVQLSGEDVATELLLYAVRRNVSTVVVGKTAMRNRWRIPRESLVERLLRVSGDLDVLVVRGLDEPASPAARSAPRWPSLAGWLGTAASLAAATIVNLAFHAMTFSEANLVMVYLLAVVIVGVRYGALQSAVAAVAAVLLFDVLFTRPYYAVAVHDTQYLITFSVMLGVGFLASSLTARIARQAELARRNQRRAETLYQLNHRLAAISGPALLARHAEAAVGQLFDAHAVVFLPDGAGRIRPAISHPPSFAADASELLAAQWVFDHHQHAGLGTGTFSDSRSIYLPLLTADGAVGVLAVQPADEHALESTDARQLLETCATQIALALERDRLTEQSQEVRVQIEAEKLRSSLLSAISHDLRTPLAGIAGASSILVKSFESMVPATRRELLETICEEAEHLARLVENLLNMTRLSSGKVPINRQWQPVEEVVGSSLSRLHRHLGERSVTTAIPEDLPLGHFDAVLIEQVLINLIENADKYSPPGAPIAIAAEATDRGVALEVSDRGVGLQDGEEQRVFEMFYRGATAVSDRRGTGLGLTICKAIADAHGGEIRAARRPGGGTIVRLELPSVGQPPQIDAD